MRTSTSTCPPAWQLRPRLKPSTTSRAGSQTFAPGRTGTCAVGRLTAGALRASAASRSDASPKAEWTATTNISSITKDHTHERLAPPPRPAPSAQPKRSGSRARHVATPLPTPRAPHLHCIYSGQLRLYPVAELERWIHEQVGATGPQRRRCRTCQAKTPRPDIKGYSRATSSIARSGTDDAVTASRATTVPSTIAPASGTSRPSGLPTAEAARNARPTSPRRVERGEAPITNAVRLRRRARAVRGGCAGRQGAEQTRASLQASCDRQRGREPPAPRGASIGNKRLSDIRRGDMQAIVDELAPELSGSRVRSVVNAVRSLYRWAQDRDLASHDPAALVRLPGHGRHPDRARRVTCRVRGLAGRVAAGEGAAICARRLRDGTSCPNRAALLARR